MSLSPLLQSDLVIQIHAFAAIAATVLGACILWRRKGTALHKAAGRVWVVLMLITVTSALFINEIRLIGPFSPIHLFSLFTYYTLFFALKAIERNVARHRAEMQGLYVGALILAGAFTFLPGRRMHEVLFGPGAGWTQSLLVIVPVLAVSGLAWLRMRRRAQRAA
ncbi:putative membrane protein [Devosia subaequoris]|uniref:Putative membrane protein n=1 Tax=Devosia subaequoris TaxID=395930 RepID=A0A7W6NBY8_9HYPH|nr:DUF2306 domain-containing protein [Devosia subaequoris]MBB4053064.1 putative membrane protein [Devosia subaequoris]MCP1210481.1 DUF2306 domain-containing protein [Devosia subaequoris]